MVNALSTRAVNTSQYSMNIDNKDLKKLIAQCAGVLVLTIVTLWTTFTGTTVFLYRSLIKSKDQVAKIERQLGEMSGRIDETNRFGQEVLMTVHKAAAQSPYLIEYKNQQPPTHEK